MAKKLIALAVVATLMACSNPDEPATPSLSGTWNVAAPSFWSTFRLTLTQTGSTVVGSATILPDYSNTGGNYPAVTGTAAVDTFALHIYTYSDGALLDLYGHIIVDRSMRATLVFTDASGVTHPVSQNGELDRSPTELHFNK